jgi:gluconokinase
MQAPVVVIMGVSGSGKSTVGRLLADALGVVYIEGDDLHPPRNVQLMASGTPLTDDDRRGWLQAIAARLTLAHGVGAVVTCSALKRAYRDVLRAASPGLRLVYLYGDKATLERRMNERQGHYMPPTLLPSQLAALEPPGPGEGAWSFDVAVPAAEIVARLRRQLEGGLDAAA